MRSGCCCCCMARLQSTAVGGVGASEVPWRQWHSDGKARREKEMHLLVGGSYHGLIAVLSALRFVGQSRLAAADDDDEDEIWLGSDGGTAT